MAEQLKIVIDAEVNKAITNLKSLETSLSKLATGSVKQLEAAAAGLRNQLESLSATALKSDFGKSLSASLQKVESRLKIVKQEAGLMAKETDNTFGKLSNQLKSFTGLVPSLAIGFALGAASTAIDNFIQKLFEGKSGLNDFAQASKEAFQKTGEESFRLEGLISIAKDVTASTKARKEAIDELQKTYPAYLKNISLENINSLETTKAINALTDATFNKALADVFAAKGAAKQLQIFEKIEKIKFLADQAGKSPKGGIQEELALSALKLENKRLDKLIEERDVLKEQFKDTQQSLFDVIQKPPPKEPLKKTLDDTLERARQFVKQFGEVFVVPDLEVSFTNTKEKVAAAAKKLINDIDKGLLIGRTFGVRQIRIPIELELVPVGKSLQEVRDNLFKNIFPTGGKQSKLINGLVPGVSEDVAKKNKEFFDAFQLQVKATADLVTGVLAPAFTDMFDAITQSKDPLKAFFNGLKDAVSQLIKKLIQAAIQAAVLSAISGGTAGGFSGIFSALLGFTKGSSANFGLGGAVGSRAFNNVIQVNVVGQISGQQINLVSQRAANSNLRGG